MRKSGFGFMVAATMIGALAQVAAGAEQAPARVKLSPQGDWRIERREERCTLSRSFAADGQTVGLSIESFGDLKGGRVAIWGSSLPKSRRAGGELRFRLTGDPDWREAQFFQRSSSALVAIGFASILGPDVETRRDESMSLRDFHELQNAAFADAASHYQQVEALDVALPSGIVLAFALGSLGEPMRKLSDCVAELQQSWGLDPHALRQLATGPEVTEATFNLLTRSYPKAMVYLENEAFVPIRALVDERGAVTSCVVQIPTIPRPFQDAVCGALENGLEPGRNASGEPVRSLYALIITYNLD